MENESSARVLSDKDEYEQNPKAAKKEACPVEDGINGSACHDQAEKG